jgi:hypothetical protein
MHTVCTALGIDVPGQTKPTNQRQWSFMMTLMTFYNDQKIHAVRFKISSCYILLLSLESNIFESCPFHLVDAITC